jgi:hypothetical protein
MVNRKAKSLKQIYRTGGGGFWRKSIELKAEMRILFFVEI